MSEPIRPWSFIANIGKHHKKVDLLLHILWERDIAMTVWSIPQPSRCGSERWPHLLITRGFKLVDILEAYTTFGNAAKTKALKVIISNCAAPDRLTAQRSNGPSWSK